MDELEAKTRNATPLMVVYIVILLVLIIIVICFELDANVPRYQFWLVGIACFIGILAAIIAACSYGGPNPSLTKNAQTVAMLTVSIACVIHSFIFEAVCKEDSQNNESEVLPLEIGFENNVVIIVKSGNRTCYAD